MGNYWNPLKSMVLADEMNFLSNEPERIASGNMNFSLVKCTSHLKSFSIMNPNLEPHRLDRYGVTVNDRSPSKSPPPSQWASTAHFIVGIQRRSLCKLPNSARLFSELTVSFEFFILLQFSMWWYQPYPINFNSPEAIPFRTWINICALEVLGLQISSWNASAMQVCLHCNLCWSHRVRMMNVWLSSRFAIFGRYPPLRIPQQG